jgi:hypothetical protein
MGMRVPARCVCACVNGCCCCGGGNRRAMVCGVCTAPLPCTHVSSVCLARVLRWQDEEEEDEEEEEEEEEVPCAYVACAALTLCTAYRGAL